MELREEFGTIFRRRAMIKELLENKEGIHRYMRRTSYL